jgi:hypothetical protein
MLNNISLKWKLLYKRIYKNINIQCKVYYLSALRFLVEDMIENDNLEYFIEKPFWIDYKDMKILVSLEYYSSESKSNGLIYTYRVNIYSKKYLNTWDTEVEKELLKIIKLHVESYYKY